ncbi:MAG TPA: hypothetical protein VGL46_17715 [Pseudonocardiaceae bacterium]|jgi:hypothetical protein
MTTNATAMKESLSLATTPVVVCSNPECDMEVWGRALLRHNLWHGLCVECHEDGVTPPVEFTPVPKPAPANKKRTPQQVPATTTTKAVAPQAEPKAETPVETAARLTSLGLDPATGDVRRCGTCEDNISNLPEGLEYCSDWCEEHATEWAAAQAAEAQAAAEAETAEAQAEAIRNGAMACAVEVVRFAYPTLNDFEAKTGLTSAVAYWSDGKVAGKGIEAAARVWSTSPSGDAYPDMTWFEKGRANSKALGVMKRAIQAAEAYRATMQG